MGTKYLNRVLRKFKGNIVYALAGYNAGPSRVDKWRRDADEDWGMLEFIEGIPYSETRNYVRKIIRNYYWNAYIINGQKTDLSYFWQNGPNGE